MANVQDTNALFPRQPRAQPGPPGPAAQAVINEWVANPPGPANPNILPSIERDIYNHFAGGARTILQLGNNCRLDYQGPTQNGGYRYALQQGNAVHAQVHLRPPPANVAQTYNNVNELMAGSVWGAMRQSLNTGTIWEAWCN